MRKQCPICRLQVTPSLDGSCPECGVSLDDSPETVEISSTSMTSCLACGSFLLGSEESCPACGVALPPPGAPVGVLPNAKPDGARTLGAPRPQNAEDAQIWAGLPVGWSADGDTNPDAVKAPTPASAPAPVPARPAIPPTPVTAAPVTSPSNVAPVPVPAPFLSAATAPAKAAPAASIEAMPAGARLELATAKKSPTKEWDRKWQRAEAEAKRVRPKGAGRGRAMLYLFGLVVVLATGGAIAAQSLGYLAPIATPTPVSVPSVVESATATPEATAEATPATPTPTPAKLLPLVTREQRLARAESLAKNGKLADAIKEYDLLLEFEPELAEVHFRQASLYAKVKNYGKACVAYRRYLEIEPEGEHAKVANAGAIRCR